MNPSIAVLAIGDELLNGEISDTNTARIARRLEAHGYHLRESLAVADAESDIGEALLGLAEKREVVIVTGGLGPTGDDLTARAAARALGRPLVLNDEALTQIRAFFARIDKPMHPRNEKQALLPQKSTILPNPLGTAPGFLLQQNGKELFFLPGVPAEMEAMLEAAVLPQLARRSGGTFPRRERIFKLFGLAEPKTEEMLADLALPEGVGIGFGVDFPLVHLKLRAAGEDAETLLDRAELVVRRQFDAYIVAVDAETLPENVGRLLGATGLTLALAESCTGGWIAKLLTDVPGASSFLERGAVTYSNLAKQHWLGVTDEILERHGAVSEPCALAMARGMRRAAGTDLALAVTGIAGPEGGTPDKPVGTVFLALAADGEEQVHGYRFGGDRNQVRLLAAHMGLEWLRRFAAARL